jgi:RimJ/RimL family protein N-acetyltransferase
VIETRRLHLVPWPAGAADLVHVGLLLGARIPTGWRPDVLDLPPSSNPRFGAYAMLDAMETLLLGSAGFTGPPSDDGAVELGYEVAPPYRGRGYATEAAGALVRWALAQPEVSRVIAATDADNPASIRVLERVGFRRAGTRGEQLLWALSG